MAATIVTITKVGDSNTKITIKVNDGCPIPDQVVTDAVENFRTWTLENNNHIFVWTDNGQKRSMIVPQSYIGWIISTALVDDDNDRFVVDVPCAVTIEDELLI